MLCSERRFSNVRLRNLPTVLARWAGALPWRFTACHVASVSTVCGATPVYEDSQASSYEVNVACLLLSLQGVLPGGSGSVS